MTTARDIIYRALEDVGIVGVGQTPLAEDLNFGLQRFNAMIGQFNRRRWLVFHTVLVSCITTGNPVYSFGQGGNFNYPRVDKLETGCFFRQAVGGSLGTGDDFNNDFNQDFGPLPNPSGGGFLVDYPLTLLESRADFNRIALKNLPSWPSFIFYDAANVPTLPIGANPGTPTYPVGYVHINPVPMAGQFEIFLNVKDLLVTLSNLSTVLATPPEYEEAFEFNLALRFAAKYQIEASREIIGLAKAALATIRSANTQVPQLQLPVGLTQAGARYSVWSDRAS